MPTKKALDKMKKGKAACCSKTVTEILKAAGGIEVKMLTAHSTSVIRESRVPDIWLVSVIVNCCKGNALECGD